MKSIFSFVLLVGIIAIFNSCNKDENNTPVGSAVEVYLIGNFETEQYMKIVNSTVQISGNPLISYTDIVSYQPSTHSFIFSTIMADSLSHFNTNGLLRKAFAVTVDRKVIYTGYFWTNFFSSSCDWYIMNLGGTEINDPKLFTIELGYPGVINNDQIEDYRNDSRILNVLRADGKLIE